MYRCSAKVMVITRLKMQYTADDNIFKCVLHDENLPTVRGRSVALTFSRTKGQDDTEQKEHREKVFKHHNINEREFY